LIVVLATNVQPSESCSDNQSPPNSYANVASCIDTANNNGSWIFVAPVVTSSGTFTINPSIACEAIAYELAGCPTSGYTDGTPGAVASALTVGATTAISMAMGTLANATDLILSVIQPSSGEAITPGPGFTVLLDQHAGFFYAMSQTTTSALGTANATATMASSDVWTIATVAFKSAAVAGKPPPGAMKRRGRQGGLAMGLNIAEWF
jgi:hypothetical protein